MESYQGKKNNRMMKEVSCGFCMALADSVPGVSGGTVALLAGIYDRFIRSFGEIIHGNREKRKSALLFLLKLGAGWVVGMALAVTLLANVFTDGIYQVSSLFIGLILASIPVIIWEERKTLKGKYQYLICTAFGIAVVVGLSLIHFHVPVEPGSWNFFTVIYILIAGILAISAMFLPGISGSTLLLSFGLYMPIITGIKNLLHFDFSAFLLLFVFGIGVLGGIVVSLRGIRFLLDENRCAVIYTVIGMMVGSLYAILQGPTTLKTPLAAVSFTTFNWIWFAVGVLVVALFTAVKMIAEKRCHHD